MGINTIGLAEAKNNFSRVTAEVNRTGEAVTVYKNNKPWVVIVPAAAASIVSESEKLEARKVPCSLEEALANAPTDLLDSMNYECITL